MTEKEKIDAAVAKALADAKKEAEAAHAKAIEDARADAIEEGKQLAIADADAERQKAIDEAVANARAEAEAKIAEIQSQANAAIAGASAQATETARRGGKTGKLRHYVLIGVSFIGGSLLAPGSRVTSDDLGTYRDPVTGEDKPVKPGEMLVEINPDGSPIDEAAAWKLQSIAGQLSDMAIAAVQPFSPNPTAAQGAPAQPAGGVSLAEGQLRTGPAPGVESDAAALARSDHANNQATAVAAMTAGEKPRRRSAS